VRGVCVCVGAVERVRIVVCLGFESRLNLGGELYTRQHASVHGQLKLSGKLCTRRNANAGGVSQRSAAQLKLLYKAEELSVTSALESGDTRSNRETPR